MTTSVRVGVIGVGAPWHHLPALARMEEVTLAAVCDIDEARLSEATHTYGVEQAFADYRQMLDRVALDAVFVLPSVLKTVEIAAACLERSLHVFVEKPAGVRVEETAGLARLAAAQGVISMVGFNRRFHPLVTLAREFTQGAGAVSTIVAEWYKPLLMQDMGRTFPPAVLERLLSVTTIHTVDLLRFLGGQVEGIQALKGAFYGSYDDAVHALLHFSGGGVGILISEYHTTKLERLHIHAAGLLVELEGIDAPFQKGRVFQRGAWHDLVPPAGDATDADGFYDEDRHFIQAVQRGVPVTPEGADLADAVRSMALADEIARVALPVGERAHARH